MKIAGAPLGLNAGGSLTVVDCEACWSRSVATGEEVLRLRCSSSNRGLWELRSRRRSVGIHLQDTIQSRFWNCEERWRRRRDSHSIMWADCPSAQEFTDSASSNSCDSGFQRRRGGQIRNHGVSFETRKAGESSGHRMAAVSMKRPLSVSTYDELFEPAGMQAVGRRKGRWSSKLYAAPNPYETLGVPDTATDKEIKQAYRRLALKFHPDVNKEPDAQQKFMQIKNAYQTLVDEENRARYEASKRRSPSWDPFSWEAEKNSAQKPQEEEFYGFGEFFKDVAISIDDFFRDLQADSRRKGSKPKSLWEELADIGEEFVEFLEKELNINDTVGNEENRNEAWNDTRKSDTQEAKEKSDGQPQNGPRNQKADKAKVETEIAEIEEMLEKLKKELGI